MLYFACHTELGRLTGHLRGTRKSERNKTRRRGGPSLLGFEIPHCIIAAPLGIVGHIQNTGQPLNNNAKVGTSMGTSVRCVCAAGAGGAPPAYLVTPPDTIIQLVTLQCRPRGLFDWVLLAVRAPIPRQHVHRGGMGGLYFLGGVDKAQVWGSGTSHTKRRTACARRPRSHRIPSCPWGNVSAPGMRRASFLTRAPPVTF